MNIASLFFEAVKKYPSKVAIIEKNAAITYSDLASEVKATAAYFASKGIKQGDRVIVFVPMGIDLYRIVLALFYMGATAVFLDQWVDKKRLDLSCKLAQAKGFIGVFKTKFLFLFSKELRKIPVKLSLRKQTNPNLKMAAVSQDTPALITFTTGSTGLPKAAERSHGFLKQQFNALLDEINPKESDIDMPVLPIVLFMNLGLGCTSVIADFNMSKPNKINISKIVQQIEKQQVNRIIASPFFVKKLAEHLLNTKASLPVLQKIFTGGAPVFPNEADLYCKAFPTTDTVVVYGSTEVEPISSINAKDLSVLRVEAGLAVGEVFHSANVKIIQISDANIASCTRSELEKIELEMGSIGEIIVSGKHVLEKYYNNKKAFEANKIVVANTVWHRTGDSGFIENKQLFLTGRCKQLIAKDGELLSPFIIENKLQLIVGVTMGTLIEKENQLILVLETKLPITVLKTKITDIPYDRIEILNNIPRDPRHNSKIDYGKLSDSL